MLSLALKFQSHQSVIGNGDNALTRVALWVSERVELHPLTFLVILHQLFPESVRVCISGRLKVNILRASCPDADRIDAAVSFDGDVCLYYMDEINYYDKDTFVYPGGCDDYKVRREMDWDSVFYQREDTKTIYIV